ncbi:hypothetical protein BJX99DRAFT_232539 [Aspergillus californicus]
MYFVQTEYTHQRSLCSVGRLSAQGNMGISKEQDVSQMLSDVIIIGGGIIGSVSACFLSTFNVGKKITVIDRSFSRADWLNRLCPRFVGQLNESEALTRFAIDSVIQYSNVPRGV